MEHSVSDPRFVPARHGETVVLEVATAPAPEPAAPVAAAPRVSGAVAVAAGGGKARKKGKEAATEAPAAAAADAAGPGTAATGGGALDPAEEARRKRAAEKEARRAGFTAKAEKNKEEAKTTAAAAAAGGAGGPAPDIPLDTTPAGEKKDMTRPMLPAYHPKVVEAAWDQWWAKSGFYTPDVDAAIKAGEAGRFVMVIPPPNVTGSLHLGHALMVSIEDAIARWHRMHGRPVLWLPGTDHAGIATQAVVEKRLMRESGLSRHDLGREKFIEKVWEWKEKYGGRICSQLRSLGGSVDWSREAFTMDEKLSRAVNEAFVRMFDKGLIYRDTRLVNWSCALNTAIADIEVDFLDLEKRTLLNVPGHDKTKRYEFGIIHEFAYKVEGSDEEIVVATTRLETMLGDTAVAVHPADPRYAHLHGKFLVHPFVPRRIPIICDPELVDMAFGTGAVKVTPAHDPNDFLCGRRHGLPEITVFSENGAINENGGMFAGMMRFDARIAVEKELARLGLFRGKNDNKMRLGVCSRSGDVIEPLLKPQWWVDCKGMAARAVRAVQTGELEILPEFHKETWYRWLENIRDWCISRQLWWGHRIPAYFVTVAGQEKGADTSREHWVVARTREEAERIAADRFHVPVEAITLRQDEDVLDTWFSSGLFPFSTMGWPDASAKDMEAFYPGTLLETGHDILFFWVARMVMMGLELTDQLPFKTVYLHAIVRDKYGRKMSKSLGNVIDPLEVIEGCPLAVLHEKLLSTNLPEKEIEAARKNQEREFPDGIPECGADALRFGLLWYTLQGRDINLDTTRVVAFRHFCNKLWNATRFALTHLAPEVYTSELGIADIAAELAAAARDGRLAPRDAWILARLNDTIRVAELAFKEYEIARGCERTHSFWLNELCDVYLELLKPVFRTGTPEAQRLARLTLLFCLDAGLRLLHPMMPFVTEELWQRLPCRGKTWCSSSGRADPASIMVAPFPTPIEALDNDAVVADLTLAMDIIRAARGLRSDANLKPSLSIPLFVASRDATAQRVARTLAGDICTLAGGSAVECVDRDEDVPAGCSLRVLNEAVSVHILLKGMIDVTDELKRLDGARDKAQKNLAGLLKRLEMPGYEDKVPEEIRAKNAQLIEDSRSEIARLELARDRLAALA